MPWFWFWWFASVSIGEAMLGQLFDAPRHPSRPCEIPCDDHDLFA